MGPEPKSARLFRLRRLKTAQIECFLTARDESNECGYVRFRGPVGSRKHRKSPGPHSENVQKVRLARKMQEGILRTFSHWGFGHPALKTDVPTFIQFGARPVTNSISWHFSLQRTVKKLILFEPRNLGSRTRPEVAVWPAHTFFPYDRTVPTASIFGLADWNFLKPAPAPRGLKFHLS